MSGTWATAPAGLPVRRASFSVTSAGTTRRIGVLLPRPGPESPACACGPSFASSLCSVIVIANASTYHCVTFCRSALCITSVTLPLSCLCRVLLAFRDITLPLHSSLCSVIVIANAST